MYYFLKFELVVGKTTAEIQVDLTQFLRGVLLYLARIALDLREEEKGVNIHTYMNEIWLIHLNYI
jgi:hypothetical protein